VKGKTAYMSPEQAMGEAALDLRSDLYSVGAVLFECVGGRKMWEGTEMEVLRHLALDEPPKLEETDANAPAELCALYTKLVSKNPDDRPSSAQEVANELRAFAARHEHSGSDALRALMKRLFAAEAVKRKSELETALAFAAPCEADLLADDLRASLTPDVASHRKSHGEIVTSVQSRREEKRPFSSMLLAALVIVAIGGASFLAIRAKGDDVRDHAPATSETTTPTPTASAAPTPPTPTSSANAISSAFSAPPATATAVAHSTAHDGAAKVPSNPASTKAHDKPGTDKPGVKGQPNLDVDPNPI
jgi:serine/threonine protein kinase